MGATSSNRGDGKGVRDVRFNFRPTSLTPIMRWTHSCVSAMKLSFQTSETSRQIPLISMHRPPIATVISYQLSAWLNNDYHIAFMQAPTPKFLPWIGIVGLEPVSSLQLRQTIVRTVPQLWLWPQLVPYLQFSIVEPSSVSACASPE